MPAQLSTHVLDTMHGTPAAGLRIDLWRIVDGGVGSSVNGSNNGSTNGGEAGNGDEAGNQVHLKTVTTNTDGRTDEPLLREGDMLEGRYLLLFHIADYFASKQVSLPEPPFLDIVPIRFAIFDANSKYHVPLLVSPWAYSTYRGS